MHHSLRLELGKNLVKQRAVRDIADNQSGRSGKRGTMSMREIIEDDGLVTTVEQLPNNHTSDVTSAASYEYSLCHACDGLVSKEIVVILIREMSAGKMRMHALVPYAIVICAANRFGESISFSLAGT
jgi:hypothetical protein